MAILVFGDFFVFTNHIRSTRFIIENLRKEKGNMFQEEISTRFYRVSKHSEIRENFKQKGVTEEDFRDALYASNDRAKPDDGIEEFVQRIFHPTEENLQEEKELDI